MKHLHCTTCKFTLPMADADEAKAYKANLPMHCGAEMVPDGALAPAEEPEADEPKKKKSKKK